MKEKLLNQILSNESLNMAYQRVVQNQGVAGVDGMTISELKDYLQMNHKMLRKLVRNQQYKPQPVRRVEIPKDNGDKRPLGIPTVVDRVLQQSIHQVIRPLFESQFHNDSYGYRPGRSCEMALKRSLAILNEGFIWVVDLDLEKFFDTINHDKLMRIVSKTIKDKAVRTLIKSYLTSGVIDQGKFYQTSKGVCQGGPLSPLLSNIMLNELDQKLASKGLKFVRYADDVMIFTKRLSTAKRVMKFVSRYLTDQLDLVVNMDKSKISRPTEVKFLSFGYVKVKRQWQAVPHPESVNKFQRKLTDLMQQNLRLPLSDRNQKIKQTIQGWVVYFRSTEMKEMLMQLDKELKYRMRVTIWKGWVAQNRQIISLVKLGVSKKEAEELAWSLGDDDTIANSKKLQHILSDKKLKELGVPSIGEYYLRCRV